MFLEEVIKRKKEQKQTISIKLEKNVLSKLKQFAKENEITIDELINDTMKELVNEALKPLTQNSEIKQVNDNISYNDIKISEKGLMSISVTLNGEKYILEARDKRNDIIDIKNTTNESKKVEVKKYFFKDLIEAYNLNIDLLNSAKNEKTTQALGRDIFKCFKEIKDNMDNK